MSFARRKEISCLMNLEGELASRSKHEHDGTISRFEVGLSIDMDNCRKEERESLS